MEAVKKLEKMIEGWLKPVPHLPTSWQKWLGENVWWLNLIGVILTALALLAGIGAILTALSLMGAANSFYGYYYAQSYSSWWVLSAVVSLIGVVVTLTLTAMAISPLKDQKRKGWDLLFMATVVSVVMSVVSTILNFNVYSFVPSLVGTAIGAFIGMYLLYEIRSHFNAATVVAKEK